MSGLRIVSWNVNGLRAVLRKGMLEPFLGTCAPDILCLQETKIDEANIPPDVFADYPERVFHCAEKKGYSGTAILSKVRPLGVTFDFPKPWREEHPQEGRIITAEFDRFYLVNVYVPNSQRGLTRLDYRQGQWDRHLADYLQQLGRQKPVIVTGDFNVAHQEIDLANPKNNVKNAGFTPEERAGFTHLLEHAGLVDSFRHFYPEKEGAYSWWSYRPGIRERNIGWRIDYFLVAKNLCKSLQDATIHADVQGSDHCPVSIELALA